MFIVTASRYWGYEWCSFTSHAHAFLNGMYILCLSQNNSLKCFTLKTCIVLGLWVECVLSTVSGALQPFWDLSVIKAGSLLQVSWKALHYQGMFPVATKIITVLRLGGRPLFAVTSLGKAIHWEREEVRRGERKEGWFHLFSIQAQLSGKGEGDSFPHVLCWLEWSSTRWRRRSQRFSICLSSFP